MNTTMQGSEMFAQMTGRAVEAFSMFAEANQKIMRDLVDLSASTAKEGVRLYAESLANVLAVHLLRHYTTGTGQLNRISGGLSAQRLRQVMTFVGENYSHDIRLSQLAEVAGMSSFHFAREFKRTTGTTPHQYLIKFRVERAKALLVEGEMPLIEVGLQSGFSHQSHFTRLFRRLTGTTPQSYRLMLQT